MLGKRLFQPLNEGEKLRNLSVLRCYDFSVEILRQKREDEILERQALRTLLASRAEQPRLDVASFDQRLGQMLNAKQRAHGLDT